MELILTSDAALADPTTPSSTENLLPAVAVAAALALAVVMLGSQAYLSFNWRAAYDRAQLFGDACEYALGDWGGADTFDAVAARTHAFKQLDMPYKSAPRELFPNVGSNQYMYTRCKVDPRTLNPNAFAWLQLGRLFGDSTVYVNGVARLAQTDNGTAGFPLTSEDRAQPFQVQIVSRPTAEAPRPGLAASLPPFTTDDRIVLMAVDRVTALFFVEMPLFRVGYSLALLVVFLVAWILGIRYPDVGWLISSLTLLGWFEFASFHPTLANTNAEVLLKHALRFAMMITYPAFLFTYLRLKLKPWRLEAMVVAAISAYTAALYIVPSSSASTLELRYLVPSIVVAILLAVVAALGRRHMRNLEGKRRSRVRLVTVATVVMAVLVFAQGLLERTTDIDFTPFLPIFMATLSSLFLGADLVVFHREFFKERAQRLEEGQQRALLQERLRLGRSVQEMLLPKKLDGELGALQYRLFYEPAGEMSGDWIAVWPSDDGLRLLMGDVVGKGPYAAVAVSAVIAAISECRTASLGMPETIARVNDRLIDLFHNEITTTLTAIAATTGGAIDLYNCGGSGFVAVGREVRFLPLRSTPLGSGPTPTFATARIELRYGETLCAFSDGCLSGSRAFKSLVYNLRKLDPLTLTPTELYRIINDLGKSTVIEDDRSMMVVKATGRAQVSRLGA